MVRVLRAKTHQLGIRIMRRHFYPNDSDKRSSKDAIYGYIYPISWQQTKSAGPRRPLPHHEIAAMQEFYSQIEAHSQNDRCPAFRRWRACPSSRRSTCAHFHASQCFHAQYGVPGCRPTAAPMGSTRLGEHGAVADEGGGFDALLVLQVVQPSPSELAEREPAPAPLIRVGLQSRLVEMVAPASSSIRAPACAPVSAPPRRERHPPSPPDSTQARPCERITGRPYRPRRTAGNRCPRATDPGNVLRQNHGLSSEISAQNRLNLRQLEGVETTSKPWVAGSSPAASID
jgi:hypothetical protein